MRVELAAQILKTLESGGLKPPAPTPDTAAFWAECLGAREYPDDLWYQACKLLCSEMEVYGGITPRHVLHAAETVKTRWEVDPQQKHRLVGYRERRREEFEARHLLRPEDVPKQVHKPAAEIPDSREVDVLAELRRRAAAKQAQIDGQDDERSA